MKQDFINKIRQLIEEFIETITSNIPNDNLDIMINNLNNIKIKFINYKILNYLLSNDTLGMYDPLRNTLILDKNNYDKTINHELFHVASSINYSNGLSYSGFHKLIINNNKIIDSTGIGINEGYTQYLTLKYFSDKREIIEAYNYQVRIASLVEKIIGIDKMQSLYFKANLYGLTRELENYNEHDKVLKFINNTDFLHKEILNPTYKGKNIDITINIFRDVHIFLIETYIHKLLEELNLQTINEEEFNYKVALFIEKIPSTLETEKITYKNILTIKIIKECLQNMLEEKENKIKRK